MPRINNQWSVGNLRFGGTFWIISLLAACSAMVSIAYSSTSYATVQSLSTGTNHACAVADFKVSCWGSGASGQLGNRSSSDATTPVTPYIKEAWTETVRECTGVNIFGNCIGGSWRDRVTNHAASALYGKSVTKVSSGYNHTCSLASARVYCWGNNDRGQLGNRSTQNSNQPVAVDIANTVPAKPGYCNGSSNGITGCGFPTGNWVNEVPAVPASALYKKEIIDISAGYYFSCALASDGTVACWGDNGQGQLGTGNTTTRNYPVTVSRAAAVPMKPGYCNGSFNGLTGCGFPTGVWVNEVPAIPASALQNKKVKKLAKLSGTVSTMCVLTEDNRAVCWGGNDVGQTGSGALQSRYSSAPGSNRVNQNNRCAKTNESAIRTAMNQLPKTAPDVLQPITVDTNLTFSEITLVGEGERDVDALIEKVGSKTRFDERINGSVYASAIVAGPASAEAKVHYWGGSVTYIIDLTCKSNGNAGGSQCPGANGEKTNRCDSTKTDATVKRVFFPQSSVAGPLYNSSKANGMNGQRVAAYSGSALLGANHSDNRKCLTYSVNYIFWSETREECSESARGLACAVPASNRSSVHCDDASQTCTDNSNGSAIHIATLKALGQYRQTCTINGPKQLTSGGSSWLQSNKALTILDTGSSGFACAVANNNTIGCWGKNDKGQLGVGDKKDKTVPTQVRL